MKKNFILGTALAAVAAASAITASAAGFAKTNTYNAGMFADVNAEQWYASSVASAYELGFMKGSSATTFEPEGNMTVAEAITIASRVNDAYASKGTTFDQSGANWYDCYVKYATDAGIIAEGQFDNYERNITRAEMAEVFAKAVPAEWLNAKNDVKEIPDVPSTNAYFDELQLLYNAGVIMGNDEFGTFKPNNNIIRAEAAAIIGRVALPEQRLSKTLVDANYGDAYYLIDQGTTNGLQPASGSTDSAWQYDNRNRYGIVSNMADHIGDFYADGKVELWRDIEDVSEGLLSWEFYGSLGNAENDAYFMITDDDKNAVVSLTTKDGKFVINGTATEAAVPSGTVYFIIDTDLDNGTGTLYVMGKKVTDFNLGKYTASRVYIGSTEEGTAQITLLKVDVYKDYLANDRFVAPENSTLARWDVTGTASIVEKGGQGYADTRSAKLPAGSVAKKSFNKVSGDVVFQTLMLLPNDEDAAYISLNNGDTSVAKLTVNNDGVLKADGTKLRHHTNNIWQTLRIELDTVNGTVVYKVNGKIVYEGAADAYAATVDNITVGTTAGTVFFDDVEAYMTHDYDDYCPTPVPVTDDGYDVILNICSLWHEGQHYGWGAISGFPDIESALGYYDEGLVEVADWEIKFMVENGIDVQHLCWYSPSNNINFPIKKSGMNDALHGGFFNAKYSDMMKFTFMWENTGVNCQSLEQFAEYIWSYWMDYYFLDDRFYTIDNKLVFTVWSCGNFRKAFGGTDAGALEAIEWMNKDAKVHGFDGVMILFADGHAQDANSFANFANAGGTAAYAYHWNQDGNNADKTIARLDRNQNHGKIHVVPTVSVGFNNIGWSGERKPLAPLADHKEVLEHIKNNYLTKLDGWKSKTLIVSTWNEYGEGTYVMPVPGLHGFGYLENVAEVISGDTAHANNIFPTEQQKARLGHLYPDTKTALKHLDNERDAAANAANTTLFMFTGDDLEVKQNIESVNVEGGIAKVVAKNDGAFTFKNLPEINADEVVSIKFTMKSNNTANAQLFFMTDSEPNISEENSFVFKFPETADFAEYVIDTSTKPGWKGKVTEFRFDPLYTAGSYEIMKIEFMGIDESALPITLTIDNVPYEGPFFPVADGDEVYVAADDTKGFFSLNNFYREWSRKTGKLYILTKNNKEIVFNVGSDVALVDGKETKLKKAVELRDGLPVLPLFFLYDLAEMDYKYEDKAITVSTLDEKYQQIIDDRVNHPYQYEFEVPGDLEGFTPGFLTATVQNGVLKGSAIERVGQTPAYDPMFHLNDLSISAFECNKIAVKLKHNLPNNNNSTIEIFFTTNSDKNLNQDKSARAAIPTKSSDEFVEYIVDFSENEFWTGTITGIRLDIFHCAGDYEIDYVRFIIDEETRKANEAKIEAEKQAALERAEKGIVVMNGDAEDASQPKIFFGSSGNATVEIVKDEETGSNVWKVTPASGKVWTYISQNTVYAPGTSYKVTADVYILGTSTNKEASGQLCCNARYKDGDKVDHVVNQTVVEAGKWTTVSFTFNVSANSTDRSADQFCFYTNPVGNEGVAYMLDNIKVEKA